MFGVGGEWARGTSRNEKAKIPSTTYFAHSYILKLNLHTLVDMFQPGKAAPVRIVNVAPAVFKCVLYFCYLERQHCKQRDEINSNKNIHATNIFGFVSLKMVSKASYVKTT